MEESNQNKPINFNVFTNYSLSCVRTDIKRMPWGSNLLSLVRVANGFKETLCSIVDSLRYQTKAQRGTISV